MRIQIKAHRGHVSDQVRAYAEKRLGKLARLLYAGTLVEVTMSRENNTSIRNDHTAEAVVHTKGPNIVAHAGGLRIDGEAAGRPVHLGPDVLHSLRHERCDVRGAMAFERTHVQTLLDDGHCLVKRALGKCNIDFLQRQQMVAHTDRR